MCPSPKFATSTGVDVTTLLLVPVLVLVLVPGVIVDRLELPVDEVAAWTGTEEEGGLAPFASRACPVIGSRYQFPGGSPRQSPIVTRSYPSPLAVSIMNLAKLWTVSGWMSWASEIHCERAGLCCERIVWKIDLVLAPLSCQSRVSMS